MATGELVRLRTPPMRLEPGQEWWTDYRYQLIARIRTEAKRGVIQPVMLSEITPGFYGALVVRLKPRPPRWRKAVVLLAGVVPVVAGVVALAVQLAQWVAAYAFPALLLLGVGWVALRAITGHRVTCVGLHCSGCGH